MTGCDRSAFTDFEEALRTERSGLGRLAWGALTDKSSICTCFGGCALHASFFGLEAIFTSAVPGISSVGFL